jgi:DNA-binding Xre family transcriptional regulator
MNKSVLSRRLVKRRAALADRTVRQVGIDAGFKNTYIYQILDSDGVTLTTLNRIAGALDCNVADLLEVVGETEQEPA